MPLDAPSAGRFEPGWADSAKITPAHASAGSQCRSVSRVRGSLMSAQCTIGRSRRPVLDDAVRVAMGRLTSRPPAVIGVACEPPRLRHRCGRVRAALRHARGADAAGVPGGRQAAAAARVALPDRLGASRRHMALRRPSALKVPLSDVGRFAALAVTGYGFASICFFFALLYASASVVAVLLYTYPAMVAIVSWLLGLQRPNLKQAARGRGHLRGRRPRARSVRARGAVSADRAAARAWARPRATRRSTCCRRGGCPGALGW